MWCGSASRTRASCESASASFGGNSRDERSTGFVSLGAPPCHRGYSQSFLPLIRECLRTLKLLATLRLRGFALFIGFVGSLLAQSCPSAVLLCYSASLENELNTTHPRI